MRACPGQAVIVAAFVVGCEGSVAVCVVRPTVGVVATGVVGILLGDATSPIRTSTKTTPALISRRVATVEQHMIVGSREDTEVVMVQQLPTTQSPANK
jgi:hypothetical protein